MDNQSDDEFVDWLNNDVDFGEFNNQDGKSFLEGDWEPVDLVEGGDLAIEEQVDQGIFPDVMINDNEVLEPLPDLNNQLNEELVGDEDVLINGPPPPLHVHVLENLIVNNVVQKEEPVNSHELVQMNVQQTVAIGLPLVTAVPEDLLEINNHASILETRLAVSPSFIRWGRRGGRRRRARVRHRSLQHLYQHTAALP